jgi:ATP-dependent 26S proteasome regulatory subunit
MAKITTPNHETVTDRSFADGGRAPASHFRLYLYATVSRILRYVVEIYGDREEAFEQFPFLRGYADELAEFEPADMTELAAEEWWRDALRHWEAEAKGNLPIRSLREAYELDDDAITMLMCAGIIEEDARFCALFEAVQGAPAQRRPTVGLLQTWWSDEEGQGAARVRFRRLRELELIQLVNADAPSLECAAQAHNLLWEALRGQTSEHVASWIGFRAPETLAAMDDLIVTDSLRERLTACAAALAMSGAQALIVHGPRRNGRRTLLGALARSMGMGLLEINVVQSTGDSRWTTDDARWRIAVTMATMLHAVPVIVCDLSPGENLELPSWSGFDCFIGVVTGRQGGVNGVSAECAFTLEIETPDIETRRRLWRRCSSSIQTVALDHIAERFRLTSGNIHRAARLASVYAHSEGRDEISTTDVRHACRSLNRQTLETLATPIRVSGDWSALAANVETMQELHLLETRCRYRERLRQSTAASFGDYLNAGVRALFSGPSGAGKTLAAKLLASALQMDLYRLDLSAVVNKYIGETEKNLNQIFARAEELDVILLLDEGDALLTSRTDVGNANDRYANLETNYLLQRLESFDGILIVTTNAADRIDAAFQRRMDVVISFPPPDIMERWAIWQIHLPVAHAVDDALLWEINERCVFTGGQIRNAVLHASLLALDNGGTITSAYIENAVRREYRKTGSICPLR